jgi:TolA-binding protein
MAGLGHFNAAVEQLPRGEAQAVARFKAADCLSQLGQWGTAVSNYWIVVTNYSDLPGVRTDLTGQALHQLIRAAVGANDLKSAEAAMGRLLAEVPAESLVVNSLLVFGQTVNRLGDPTRARTFYNTFLDKFPSSPLVPEVQLALIRTVETEGKWAEATALYENWLARNPSHGMVSAAEFHRGWAAYLSGNETNALTCFTNYLARFPTSREAPLAQSWVGGYYFRAEQYDLAELEFQRLYQNTNWPASPATFQARLMAGRSAYMRQGYSDAVGYLTNLINHPQCPPTLLPEAYFALGDTYMRAAEAAGPSTNLLNNYVQALGLFEKITTGFPTNRLAGLAWGRTGDCLFQLAVKDAAAYDRAFQAYTNVIRFPGSDSAARGQAEVGLGRVREKQAAQATGADRTNLFNAALAHYLNVGLGKNLLDGEQADSFWVKEAALSGARLAEELQRWEVAANLYRRLIILSPALRETWEQRIEKLPTSIPSGPTGEP